MKRLVFNSVGVHMIAILLFTIIYSLLPNNSFIYANDRNRRPRLIDFFNLSTTTQAGVGITNIVANNDVAILTNTIQQILMIAKNIIILYFFTRI